MCQVSEYSNNVKTDHVFSNTLDNVCVTGWTVSSFPKRVFACAQLLIQTGVPVLNKDFRNKIS